MLEELACPHVSPPTLFASKHIISYYWVCVPLPGLHFLEGNSSPTSHGLCLVEPTSTVCLVHEPGKSS